MSGRVCVCVFPIWWVFSEAVTVLHERSPEISVALHCMSHLASNPFTPLELTANPTPPHISALANMGLLFACTQLAVYKHNLHFVNVTFWGRRIYIVGEASLSLKGAKSFHTPMSYCTRTICPLLS